MENNADKDGLETIVSEDKVMQKPRRQLARLPYYLMAGISTIGAAGSGTVLGMTIYKTIHHYLRIDPSMAAATPPDEPSPYDACCAYGFAAFYALVATGIFVYAVIEAIKTAREQGDSKE